MIDSSVAIITGASSGIGMETALAFAARKYSLVLAARRLDRLDDVARRCRELGAPVALTIKTDVAVEAQTDALIATTMRECGRIDVLVNNAGYGLFSRAHETTDAQMREIFDVNFFGLFHLCRLVAPIMIAAGRGHIFNVSSVIGKRGTPFHGAYCATKFAIVGLCDAMRVELAPHGVRVTCVCPALTATEFFQHSKRARQAQESFTKLKGLTPASVIGKKIAATAGKSRPELVFTAGGKFLVKAAAISPRFGDWVMGFYYRDLAGKMP